MPNVKRARRPRRGGPLSWIGKPFVWIGKPVVSLLAILSPKRSPEIPQFPAVQNVTTSAAVGAAAAFELAAATHLQQSLLTQIRGRAEEMEGLKMLLNAQTAEADGARAELAAAAARRQQEERLAAAAAERSALDAALQATRRDLAAAHDGAAAERAAAQEKERRELAAARDGAAAELAAARDAAAAELAAAREGGAPPSSPPRARPRRARGGRLAAARRRGGRGRRARRRGGRARRPRTRAPRPRSRRRSRGRRPSRGVGGERDGGARGAASAAAAQAEAAAALKTAEAAAAAARDGEAAAHREAEAARAEAAAARDGATAERAAAARAMEAALAVAGGNATTASLQCEKCPVCAAPAAGKEPATEEPATLALAAAAAALRARVRGGRPPARPPPAAGVGRCRRRGHGWQRARARPRRRRLLLLLAARYARDESAVGAALRGWAAAASALRREADRVIDLEADLFDRRARALERGIEMFQRARLQASLRAWDAGCACVVAARAGRSRAMLENQRQGGMAQQQQQGGDAAEGGAGRVGGASSVSRLSDSSAELQSNLRALSQSVVGLARNVTNDPRPLVSTPSRLFTLVRVLAPRLAEHVSPTRVLNSLDARAPRGPFQGEGVNAGVGVQPLTEAALERHNSDHLVGDGRVGRHDGAHAPRRRRGRQRAPLPAHRRPAALSARDFTLCACVQRSGE